MSLVVRATFLLYHVEAFDLPPSKYGVPIDYSVTVIAGSLLRCKPSSRSIIFMLLEGGFRSLSI